jgi:iron(III) transport system ATP-binding protein
MAFITIQGLAKSFGSFQALAGIDISIEEKEFVTFLGPSGCGKTTTLRLLAGFLTPDAGAITVGGEVVSAPGRVLPPELRRMGMVFQNYAIWPHMSVFENIAFGLRYAKIDRSERKPRVDQVLAAVGLEGLEDRHPAQLSGGQQQRVALARSLVVEPSILLLDEPLSNLDAKLRERMRSELKSLQRRTGITFIYVTHDQAEAMALSDRVVVFHQGSIQQIGPPRDIYERPANFFVADFMGQVNRIAATVLSREADRVFVSIGKHRLAVAARTGDTVTTGVVAIRPEAFIITDSPSMNGDNRFEGIVVEAIFLGNIIDYRVDIGGATIRVQGNRHAFHEIGSRIHLNVPIAECALMQDTAGDALGANSES